MKNKIKIGIILVKTRIQNYEDQIHLTVVAEVFGGYLAHENNECS